MTKTPTKVSAKQATEDNNAKLAAASAAKGDLDITDDNEPSHPDLQGNYIINGQMYGLKDIIKTVAGVGDDGNDATGAYDVWNALDDTEKLTRIKEYLVSMEAKGGSPEEAVAAEPEKRITSIEGRLANVERHLGLDRLT